MAAQHRQGFARAYARARGVENGGRTNGESGIDGKDAHAERTTMVVAGPIPTLTSFSILKNVDARDKPRAWRRKELRD
jgi:hypothetical protein